MNLIIEANREGYALDQINRTMTVGELISMLEQYDEDTPVYLGHDRQSYGWYTYGGITESCFNEEEDEEETWHVVRDDMVIFSGSKDECEMFMDADETGTLELYPNQD